jgi:hypothetical protein
MLHSTSVARSRTMGRALGLALASGAGLWLALAIGISAAQAAPAAPPPTFVVNSLTDFPAAVPYTDGLCATGKTGGVGNGVCTLRAAIMEANHWPGGGATITFAPAQTNGRAILLNSVPITSVETEADGDLKLSQNTWLRGNGAGLTIIDAQGLLMNDRVLEIDGGAAVTLTDLTVQNGTDQTGQGGGDIYLGSGGSLTLDRVIVQNGDTTSAGADGGGIRSDGNTLNVLNSTLTGNFAVGNGGAIDNNGALANIVNSTISGNSTIRAGGGVAVESGVVYLFNATVANNTADAFLHNEGQGGGIAARGGTTYLQNSLIANNQGSEPFFSSYIHTPDDCAGAPISTGYNLLSIYVTLDPTACAMTPLSGDQVTTTVNLGPLQNNGGPTPTLALLPGSAAIDAGNPNGCDGPLGVPLTTDQRGFSRAANITGITRCDIGAFEVQRLLFLPLARR